MKRGLFFAYVLILNAVFIFSNDTNLFAQSNKRDIEEFSFPEQTKPAKIGKKDVKVEVFFGANLDSLIAEFELSKGANAYVNGVHQVSGVTANDFTNPVTYTVVAEDEMSTKDWKVTVSVTPNTEADIISYSFVEQTGPSTINYNRNLIEVEVVYGSDVNNLVATFTLSENASATVGKKEQISGETSNNFSNPVTYVVTAEDEESLKAWIVIVTVAENANTDFLTYSFTEQSGTVAIDTSNHTVNIEVEFGTDITELVASFTLSDGALARIGSIEQESGTTSNNFVEPVTYTITAMDGVTVQDWVVSVTVKRNNETEILTYSIMDQTGDAVFNANAGTIDLEVVYGIDLTSLIADFTLSQQAVASIEDTEQISGVSVNDFSSPVIYTVTAGDGTVKEWIITVIEAPNTATDLSNYIVAGQTGSSTDAVNHTVSVTVPYGTKLSSWLTTFDLSAGATASPSSGSTINYSSNNVVITVTAEDGVTEQDWAVAIVEDANTETAITNYSFPEQVGPTVLGSGTVDLNVPYGTSVTALVATFTLSPQATARIGNTVQNSGVTANNFTSNVTYVIEAGDGSTQNWLVRVTEAPNNETEILSLDIGTNIGVINDVAKTVTVTVPFGTDVTSLQPTFSLSDQAIARVAGGTQTSGVSTVDFTSPVTYSVIAGDLTTTTDWVVTVVVAPNTENDILTYSLPGQTSSTINGTAHTISVTVPYETNVTNMAATFTLSEQATARVGGVLQNSGVTTNNFTSPVTYAVRAGNGTVQNWVVTVTPDPNTANDILTYSLAGQTGSSINAGAHTVSVTVPYGTNLNNLVTTFTLSPQATSTVSSTPQASGVTPNNFTTPVSYVVEAGDGSTQTWVVTVSVDPNTATDILTYILEGGYSGTVSAVAHTVTVTVPYGTDLTDRYANFTLSPEATARVGGGLQESGVSSLDFSSQVTYEITAGDGTTQDWVVTVNIAPNTATDFESFSFAEQTGAANINTTNHSINIEVQYGTSLTNLVATFGLSFGATARIGETLQNSGVTSNNFSNPVTYRVTAEDGGAAQNWKVFVDYKTPNDSTEIISFSFEEQVGTTVINPIDNEIYVLVSEGTSPIGLIASFELSTGAKAYVDAVPQLSGVNTNDFSEPLIYTVIAEDGIMEQDWLVYVSSEFDFNYAKEPLAFPVSSNTIQASVNVPNYASMDKVTFHHRKIEELTWTETEVVGNLRIYSVDITRGMSGKMGMYYYFDAIDTIGNNIALEPKQLVIHYDKDYPEIPNLRFGETVNQYQIVSIPLELVNKNAGSVFDELGEYDIKYWRLFSYNSSLSITNEYNRGFTNIEPGLGYWFIAREPTDIYTGEGYTVEVDTLDGYEIDLLPGWNQIGNPFDADISWDDVRTDNNNLNIGRVKLFNRDSLSEGDLLPKFRGGFVFLSGIQPITVNVRPTRINTIARKKSNINEDKRGSLDNSSWIVGLKITNGVVTNTLSGIGMHPEAEEGLDYHDEVLLPVPKEIVPFELIFNHPEERYDKFSMDVIPTRENHIWEFEVQNSGSNKKLTISWNNKHFGNNEYQLLLVHNATETIIDMKQVESYSFTSSGMDEFRIVFGNESFVDNELKPRSVTFGNGYPNPFNDQLTIPFTLPESDSEYKVDIKVFDLKGMLVKEIANENYSSGYYEVNWNILEDAGNLGSGVYIIQMAVRSNEINTVLTRKVIKQ